MKQTTINTTIRGTFTVKACNAGTLDGSGYDHITIVRPCTCPACGKAWLRTFIYTSAAENADMYPYDTEPYAERRYIEQHCPNCREAARQNTYFFADKTYTLSVSATYTLHVETAGGAANFGFQSIEKAKTVADLLWNDSTTDFITITNDDTAEVLYLYEAAPALPF